jgi:probable rRNA maturation factor
MSRIEIEICNRQSLVSLDESALRRAITAVLVANQVGRAAISLAIVGDREIQELNRRFLLHDCPTDVLSFVFDRDKHYVEGEVVASAETAVREARTYGWGWADELILYVIHGTLHLVGYDDHDPQARRRMRKQEAQILSELGWQPGCRSDQLTEL